MIPADVSVLIPAYQAEAFIDRTLDAARAQTHDRIEIVISVDAGADSTPDRVRAHAALDGRVRLIEQPRRLGWAGNVNALLAEVRTPFAFLYFHDDILSPDYVAVLLRALEDAPEAVSAHCDMEHFGGREDISVGRPYEGDALRRLLTFLLAPQRGSPLRSLLRSEAVERLRIPEGRTGGLWGNEPFLMRMVALGPAVHVPQVLYRRWDKRKGGLTDGWTTLPLEAHLAGIAETLDHALPLLDASAAFDEERAALRAALFLYILPRVRGVEKRFARRLFSAPNELHPAFSDLDPEPALNGLTDLAATRGDLAEIAAWARSRWQAAEPDLRRRAVPP